MNQPYQYKQLIETFYTAFQNEQAEKMVECYHHNIVFRDPAFGTLKGRRAMAMWRMLLDRGKGNLKITFSNVQAQGEAGSAEWVAHYPYGKKKRRVVNHVKASFTFSDGQILTHKDTFSTWKWSRQALGLLGLLLGWSSFMKNKVQKTTNALLDSYMQQEKTATAANKASEIKL